MIKYSGWKGCEGVELKIKTGTMMELSQKKKLDGKSRDLREVRLVKTSGEREERWLEKRPEEGSRMKRQGSG